MKKNCTLFLFISCLLLCGHLFAQPQTWKMYQIKNESAGLYMGRVDANGTDRICIQSQTGDDQVFLFLSSDEGFFNLMQLSTGKYAAKDPTSGYNSIYLNDAATDDAKFAFEDAANGAFYIKNKAKAYLASDNSAENAQVYVDKGQAVVTATWLLEEVVPTEEQSAKVLVNFKSALQNVITNAEKELAKDDTFYDKDKKTALQTETVTSKNILGNESITVDEIIVAMSALKLKISEYQSSFAPPLFSPEVGVDYRIFSAAPKWLGHFMYDQTGDDKAQKHMVIDDATNATQYYQFEKIVEGEKTYYHLIPSADLAAESTLKRYVYSRGGGGSGMQVRASSTKATDNAAKWNVTYLEEKDGIVYYAFRALNDGYLFFGTNGSDMKTQTTLDAIVSNEGDLDAYRIAILKKGEDMPIMKSSLENKIAEAKAFETPSSDRPEIVFDGKPAELQAVIEAAEAVLNKEGVTQEEINDAYDILNQFFTEYAVVSFVPVEGKKYRMKSNAYSKYISTITNETGELTAQIYDEMAETQQWEFEALTEGSVIYKIKNGNSYLQHPNSNNSYATALVDALTGETEQQLFQFVYAGKNTNGEFLFNIATQGSKYDLILYSDRVRIENHNISTASHQMIIESAFPDPVLTLSETSFDFDPNNLEKTFNVSGRHLAENVILVSPKGITLTAEGSVAIENGITLAKESVVGESGVDVKATFDGSTRIAEGTISVESGVLKKEINIVATVPVSDANLLANWAGKGATGANTKPTDFGWANTTENKIPSWVDVNGGSGIRYVDFGVKYSTKSDDAYWYPTVGTWTDAKDDPNLFKDRLLWIRWGDSNVDQGSSYTYKIEGLTAGYNYKFSWKYAWHNNGGDGATTYPTIKVGISKSENVAESVVVEKDFDCSVNKRLLQEGTFEFSAPESGIYYLTIKSVAGKMNNTTPLVAVADLELKEIENRTTIIDISTSSLVFVDKAANVKTFTVNGYSEENVKLATVSGVSLSKTTITPNELAKGVEVKATYGGSSSIDNAEIKLTSGDVEKSIVVTGLKLEGTQYENLIKFWDGNNGKNGFFEGNISKANVFGWEATDVSSWENANGNPGVKFMDKVAASTDYTNADGSKWEGRAFLVRWDGTGGSANTKYSYPVELEIGKTYVFNGKYLWNSDGTGEGASSFTFGVIQADATEPLVSKEYSVEDNATSRLVFNAASFTFTAPVSGKYYLTVANDKSIVGAISELSIKEFQGLNIVNDRLEDYNVQGVLGAILIEAPATAPVSVYNVSGLKVAEYVANGTVQTLDITSGLYIVIIKDRAVKVLVK